MLDKTILIIGVFDCFHFGHLNLIKQARLIGNVYAGVVEDEAVKKVKGTDRPLISEEKRLAIIENIQGVKGAFLIPDFYIPKEAIDLVDYVGIGEDQAHIKGQENIPVEKLIRFKRTEGTSTTDFIKKLKE